MIGTVESDGPGITVIEAESDGPGVTVMEAESDGPGVMVIETESVGPGITVIDAESDGPVPRSVVVIGSGLPGVEIGSLVSEVEIGETGIGNTMTVEELGLSVGDGGTPVPGGVYWVVSGEAAVLEG